MTQNDWVGEYLGKSAEAPTPAPTVKPATPPAPAAKDPAAPAKADPKTPPAEATPMTKEEVSEFKKQWEKAEKGLSGVDKATAELIIKSGDKDKDKVQVSNWSGPAAQLKPSQSTMDMDKAVGMAIGQLKSGKIGGDLGALISEDNQIMDGHHRWAATIIATGDTGKVGGFKASLPGKELMAVLNVITKGAFGIEHGNSGSGDISAFTPANIKKKVKEFTENGIKGKFPLTKEEVQKVLEDKFGSVEKGIETMGDNVKSMVLTVPDWAPKREEMPVIDPDKGNVTKTVDMLNKGEVDLRVPYAKSSYIKALKARVAKSLAEEGRVTYGRK